MGNREIAQPGGHRPRCAVQVDMDSFAVMLRYYGHHDGPPPEMFYELAVPRLLDLFARHGIRATFFVVGADVRGNAGDWLPKLQAAGHEVANHTEHHYFCLPRLPLEQLEAEIVLAEEAIASRLGERPVGFRSPGYDVDERVLALLESRGYWYDTSVFPSSIAPAVRLRQALMQTHRQAQHGTLGRTAFLFAPRHPYRPSRARLWRADPSRPFVELPVATLPILRLPFHATAHLAWGGAYFDWGQRWLGSGDLAFAMHGVDVLGPDRDPIDPRLFAQPGVRLRADRKLTRFGHIFEVLSDRYAFVTSRELAAAHRQELAQGPGRTETAGTMIQHGP